MIDNAPISLPAELAPLVAGSDWVAEKGGASGTQVWRVRTPGRVDRYLKLAGRRESSELRREFEVLVFLDEYRLVKQVSREKCAFFELLDEFF